MVAFCLKSKLLPLILPASSMKMNPSRPPFGVRVKAPLLFDQRPVRVRLWPISTLSSSFQILDGVVWSRVDSGAVSGPALRPFLSLLLVQ